MVHFKMKNIFMLFLSLYLEANFFITYEKQKNFRCILLNFT